MQILLTAVHSNPNFTTGHTSYKLTSEQVLAAIDTLAEDHQALPLVELLLGADRPLFIPARVGLAVLLGTVGETYEPKGELINVVIEAI